jgi:hypothetical protein
MPSLDLRGIAASAKLAGHPLHPMLIPFPIAFSRPLSPRLLGQL